MQAASRQTYAAARERLDGYATGATPAQLRTVADELLAVAGLLDRQPRLRRALADPSRSGEDRCGLMRDVLGTRVGEDTLALVDALVSGRWSAATELVDGCEELGVQALLAAAERDGKLAEVEDELFRLGQIVSGDPQLAATLADRTVPVARRAQLVEDLLRRTASDA